MKALLLIIFSTYDDFCEYHFRFSNAGAGRLVCEGLSHENNF